MKTGIQLYSLRSIIQNNIKETFEAIKSMGYDGVELAGLYDLSAKELKALLDEIGLDVISAHEGITNILNNTEKVIEDYQTLKTNNIVIPYTEMHDEATYYEMLPKIKEAVKSLTEAGFTVHYHNHSNEFNAFDNKYLIEHLINDIDNLYLELDVYWAKVADVDIYTFINNYQDKIKLLHAKDMIMKDDQPIFESVGEGIIDFKRIYQTINDCWIVENDNPQNDPLENIKISINNIQSLKGGKQ